MKKILATGCRPTAIVTAYDDIAYGAMRYAEANGLSIPDDISFVGIDDLTINDYSGYRLTSLHVCFEDYVCEIVDSVMRRIEDRSGEIVGPIEMPIKLIIRDTLKKIE